MSFLNLLPISNVIGSLVGAGASLIGGNQQAEAQREANEQNYKMFQEQLGFTKDMYEDAKSYNTPAQQRQRYEEAGINPYLAMSNIGAGNVEAMQSPSANPAQPAVGAGQGVAAAGQSLAGGLRDLGSSVSMVEQINAQKEAVRAARIENAYRSEHHIQELIHQQRENDKMISDKNLTDAQRDYYISQNKELNERIWRLEKTRDYDIAFSKATSDKERNAATLVYEQAVGERLQNEMRSITVQYADKIEQAKLRQLNALCAEALASAYEHGETAKLRTQQGKTEFVNTEIARLEKHGVRLSNEEKESAMGYIMEGLRLQNKSIEYNIRQQNSDYTNPFRYAGMALGGAAAAAVGSALRPSGASAVVRGFAP